MDGKIVIIAEKRREKLHPVTLECIEAAKEISGTGEIIVLVFGDEEEEELAENLLYQDADRVLYMKNSRLSRLESESLLPLIQQTVEAEQPSFLLFGQTDLGKNLAAALSEKINLPLVSNIVEVEKTNALLVTRQILSGNVLEKVETNTPCILSIKQKAWKANNRLQEKKGKLETIHPTVKQPSFSLVRLEKKHTGKEELANAKVIAAAGRGVQNEKGYSLVLELAKTVKGTVGVSRGAVEIGVCDAANQIGQTGETVAPKMYIACGISGAIQHLVGVTAAEMIIAINNDAEAPIFQNADYGIIGDVFEVLPLLKKELDLL
ncbi:electron transfer flavoprotein subunit alpha/FixB family protein [Niallia taxi]|uniref:electron transfer flavoprotein subunit alpha/FixB family protein n=1 Tax=Niallia taxi TaxID=2499688 RepID=UPI003F5FB02B